MDKRLLIMGSIFLLTFVSFIGLIFFDEPLARFTRASNPAMQPSAQTSLIFAWPLSAAADGQEKSEISVFIRDMEGRGIEGKQVRVTASVGQFNTSTSTTDSSGKAVFSLTSATPGVANIEAFVDNTKLLRTVSVAFE